MSSAVKAERRLSRRRRLKGLLPGKLILKETEDQIGMCKPVDVSRNGMGVIIQAELPVGTEVCLICRSDYVEMKVAWSKPDFGKQDMFRYGFVTLDPEVDLEYIFEKAKCFK